MTDFNSFVAALNGVANAKLGKAIGNDNAKAYYATACASLLAYVVNEVPDYGEASQDTRCGALHRVAKEAKAAYVQNVMTARGVSDANSKALSDDNKKARNKAQADVDGVKCRVLWAVEEYGDDTALIGDFLANGAFLVEAYKNKDGTAKQKKAAREAEAKAEAEAVAAQHDADLASAFAAGAAASLEANRMTIENAITFLSEHMADGAVVAFATAVAKAQRDAAKAAKAA